MGEISCQITSLIIVYSIVYSDADQRKHQSFASLAFVRWIQPGTGEFPAQMASNAENVSIRWRHHDCTFTVLVTASANLQPLAGHKRCHEIETLYKLLALCGRNPPIIVESYHTSGQYLTQSYDVLSFVSVNKTVSRSWVVGGLRGRNYHVTSL